MSKKENRTGEKHITNERYEIEIIEYFGIANCTIKFEDDCVVENVNYSQIKKGQIKNPNHKSVFGVGYFGQGNYKSSIRGISTKQYLCWRGVLIRCYDDKYQETRPTYKGATICEEWHNFQNFAKWYDENYVEDWCLDKDILVKGNKVYSSKTCCFVPNEINSLFTKCDSVRGKYPIGVNNHKNGKYVARINKNSKRLNIGYYPTPEEAFQAYKTAKENYIKEVADKWKDQIDPKVYEAMYNYQVEITD